MHIYIFQPSYIKLKTHDVYPINTPSTFQQYPIDSFHQGPRHNSTLADAVNDA